MIYTSYAEMGGEKIGTSKIVSFRTKPFNVVDEILGLQVLKETPPEARSALARKLQDLPVDALRKILEKYRSS